MSKIDIYFLRHARTKANEKGLFCGKTESQLSLEGKMQVSKLMRHFKEIEIDAVYTSPSQRTIETITPIIKQKKIKHTMVPAFAEMDFGKFENLDFGTIEEQYPEEVTKMIDQKEMYRYPQGESLTECFTRVAEGLEELIKKHSKDTIIICSHAGTIRHCISYLLNKTSDYHWNFQIDNASITYVTYEDSFAVFHNINNTQYLIE